MRTLTDERRECACVLPCRRWILGLSALCALFGATQAFATMDLPAELSLAEKTKMPIVFVGEISEIVSRFPDEVDRKPDTPRHSRRALARVRVVNALKMPVGEAVPREVFVRIGSTFNVPWEAYQSWDGLNAEYKGARYVFFGYDLTRGEKNIVVVNTGQPIRAVPRDKEQEVRRFLRLKN